MLQLKLWFKDQRTKIWFTPALSVTVAVLFSLTAGLVNHWAPATAFPAVSPESLTTLLGAVASSMLAVAIFSLSILVSALSSASGSATPRAVVILMDDPNTRNAISSFIAAFIYAVVTQTALGVKGYYGPAGRFVLFLGTLAMLGYLVITLILWVKTLSGLGLLGDTLTRLHKVTSRTLRNHWNNPFVNAHPGGEEEPEGTPIHSCQTGYLTHIDMAGLQETAAAHGIFFHIRLRPGVFVDQQTVLGYTQGGSVDEHLLSLLRRAFVTNAYRSYDQDPELGMIVLAEVAQRALSPAVNDPGTAIQVAAILTKLLCDCEQERPAKDQTSPTPPYSNLSLVALHEPNLVRSAFAPIARDGAAVIEVAINLQKLLHTLAVHCRAPLDVEAIKQARLACARSLAALTLDEDKQELSQLHAKLFPVPKPSNPAATQK